MIQKYIVTGLLFISGAHLYAQGENKLHFIDADFNDFVMRVVDEKDDRNQFKVYFTHLSQKMQEAHQEDPVKEQATYRYLYHLALENLKTKHAPWYQEIAPFVSNPLLTLDDNLNEVRAIIKNFLTRYGAYQEFVNYRNTKQLEQQTLLAQESSEGLWHTIKGYASFAKDTLAGLFKFNKTVEHTA